MPPSKRQLQACPPSLGKPAPGLSHSLEVSGGEEKQRWGEEHCGVWAGGSWTLSGAIPRCLQLREPVREPPVSTVACGWTWRGREKLQRFICLVLSRHSHSQPAVESSFLCTPPWASTSCHYLWSFLLYTVPRPISSMNNMTSFAEQNLPGWQINS